MRPEFWSLNIEMKYWTKFLSYLLFLAVLSTASQLQIDFAAFSCKDPSVVAFCKNHNLDPNRSVFPFSIEEFETIKEHESDSSTPNSCQNSDVTAPNRSFIYYIDFAQTAIAFVQKKALYICYSSLKIPFLAACY